MPVARKLYSDVGALQAQEAFTKSSHIQELHDTKIMKIFRQGIFTLNRDFVHQHDTVKFEEWHSSALYPPLPAVDRTIADYTQHTHTQLLLYMEVQINW